MLYAIKHALLRLTGDTDEFGAFHNAPEDDRILEKSLL
jgi:hypothetical protein